MSGSTVFWLIVAMLIVGAVTDIDNTLIGLVAGSALAIYLFGWWGVLGVTIIVLGALGTSLTPAPPQQPKSSRKTYLLLRLPFLDGDNDD